MFSAISAIAAAFCSRFIRLLRGTSAKRPGEGPPPAVWGEEVVYALRGRGRLLLRLGAGRIDLDARPHRGGQRDRLDVAALRARRLRADDLLHEGGVVVQ